MNTSSPTPGHHTGQPRREVVSFVRRTTRMNPGQERAWAARERWLVPVTRGETSTSVADGRLEVSEIFGRRAPLVVEIGSGTGDSLVAMAAADPGRDHLAFEVYRPAMASTMIKLDQAGLRNVRLVEADGVAGLRQLLGSGSVSELWTFFPDPWHKSRHHKRRLVSAEFADLVADRLVQGGIWRLATDWADYAEHCHEVLDPHPLLQQVKAADGSSPRAPHRPITRFEKRGIDAGREIVDLCFQRVSA